MAAALAQLCLRGAIPDVYSVDVAYVVLFTACALMLEGARCFDGRRASPAVLSAGALVWIAACQIPALYDSATARMIIVSAAIGFYSLGCAYVLWRGRAEPLLSRLPLIVLTALGGGLFLVRIPLAVRTRSQRRRLRASVRCTHSGSASSARPHSFSSSPSTSSFSRSPRSGASSRTSAPR
jgi:hypothetical protein